MRRWPEEMRVLRPGTAYHSIDPADLGRDDAEITDVVDASAVLERRESAMSEHRSQASPFDGLSDELRRAFLTTDHLVRVTLRPSAHRDHTDDPARSPPMSVHDVRSAQDSPPIPRPRQAGSDDVVETLSASGAMGTGAPGPWSEPRQPALGARPRTQYWDVATASWCSRGPQRD
jgi:hypothetical protein